MTDLWVSNIYMDLRPSENYNCYMTFKGFEEDDEKTSFLINFNASKLAKKKKIH